ncbi:RDD domain-containing protein [Burkholderia multivorans]|uniref:RDD family protein n=1 Tax=Burkholderia multivorans TaxID=87883 RepID=UPI0006A5F5C4|nr:RDD family protein [Burkholderia multivorans]KOE26999.1 membrane protein [Burkholderia multivorans R-20526]MBU9246084.1 RDD family protein [Burkholderia multivorans]MCO7334941.1 RDD family protein [Burkholderia multivorans]MCO7339273.1 RDD family protein [Burkholderia multivorans]MCO7344187.1 RDD family protein [Burkholderia multivorans]
MADTSALPAAAAVPSVRRRLAAMLYEAVLLFGVVFFAGLAFALATQQRNGLVHHNLLAAWIALVVGAYFVWFWTHGGQTLPMKTWRLRLEAANGRPLSAGHAIVRYALGWLWFLPPLALHPLLGLSVPVTLVLAAAWIVVWAGAARLHADRQFPHDRLARTRIVAMPR